MSKCESVFIRKTTERVMEGRRVILCFYSLVYLLCLLCQFTRHHRLTLLQQLEFVNFAAGWSGICWNLKCAFKGKFTGSLWWEGKILFDFVRLVGLLFFDWGRIEKAEAKIKYWAGEGPKRTYWTRSVRRWWGLSSSSLSFSSWLRSLFVELTELLF